MHFWKAFSHCEAIYHRNSTHPFMSGLQNSNLKLSTTTPHPSFSVPIFERIFLAHIYISTATRGTLRASYLPNKNICKIYIIYMYVFFCENHGGGLLGPHHLQVNYYRTKMTLGIKSRPAWSGPYFQRCYHKQVCLYVLKSYVETAKPSWWEVRLIGLAFFSIDVNCLPT